jgi:plasmid replication initiation protein
MENAMKKNIVVQANNLIEAHYRQTYTVQEQRTVLWLISEIHKEDYFLATTYEHKSIKISAKRYADMMDINVDNVYRDAEKIADSLGSKRFTIKTSSGWINLGWIASMEYKHGDGIIEILVAPGLLPYIIELKEGNFTSFQLENILYLKSAHAIKLYQLLSQKKKIGGMEFKVDDLRSILGLLHSKSYLEYRDLKRRVLEISKREINDKTDLTISYSEIKNGRKVESIKFKITLKQKPETNSDKGKITTVTTQGFDCQHLRLSTLVLEDAKNIAHEAGTGWDIYEIARQFQDWAKKNGNIQKLESAFLGFVKKKVAKRP